MGRRPAAGPCSATGAAAAETAAGGGRHVLLDLATIPPRDRMGVLCATFRPLWNVAMHTDAGPCPTGTVALTHLGAALLIRADLPGMIFGREPSAMAAEGSDHILVQAHGGDGVVLDGGGIATPFQAGDVGFLDLAQGFSTREPGGRTIAMLFPRARLERLAPSAGLHGIVLGSAVPAARLIRSHFETSSDVASGMTGIQAAAAVDAAMRLIAGALQEHRTGEPDARSTARARAQHAVYAYIEQHLTDDDLTAGRLPDACRMSRATLYRLFERDGGVAAYIQDRRLQRCFEMLSSAPDRCITIARLAFESGFSSETHFSRAFRRRFGMRPSDVRRSARGGAVGGTGPGAVPIGGWIATLGDAYRARSPDPRAPAAP